MHIPRTLEVLLIERGLAKAGEADEEDEFLGCCEGKEWEGRWEDFGD
jgi:hypothetical protein